MQKIARGETGAPRFLAEITNADRIQEVEAARQRKELQDKEDWAAKMRLAVRERLNIPENQSFEIRHHLAKNRFLARRQLEDEEIEESGEIAELDDQIIYELTEGFISSDKDDLAAEKAREHYQKGIKQFLLDRASARHREKELLEGLGDAERTPFKLGEIFFKIFTRSNQAPKKPVYAERRGVNFYVYFSDLSDFAAATNKTINPDIEDIKKESGVEGCLDIQHLDDPQFKASFVFVNKSYRAATKNKKNFESLSDHENNHYFAERLHGNYEWSENSNRALERAESILSPNRRSPNDKLKLVKALRGIKDELLARIIDLSDAEDTANFLLSLYEVPDPSLLDEQSGMIDMSKDWVVDTLANFKYNQFFYEYLLRHLLKDERLRIWDVMSNIKVALEKAYEIFTTRDERLLLECHLQDVVLGDISAYLNRIVNEYDTLIKQAKHSLEKNQSTSSEEMIKNCKKLVFGI